MLLPVLMILCSVPVYAAIPALPHSFYGSVDINGNPAPVNTRVEAKGPGVITGIGNPFNVTEQGKYGSPDPLQQRLIVQGDILDRATITFYVNGVSTGQTAEWHSGEVTSLPLSVTIAAPPVGGGGGGGGAMYIETNLFGTTADFRIDSQTGEILKTIEATSDDGKLTLYLPKGTIALDKDGKPLDSLEAAVDESPHDPPEGAHIIGLPYIFEPSGATFNPPITLIWSYDPDALPEGVAEEDQVIAYYDEDAGEWVELVCVVDPVTKTITASVSHFTTIAIIGFPPAAFTLSSLAISPAEVALGEKVNINISVANTGAREGSYTVVLKINGVKEAEKSATINAGTSQKITFSVSRKEAGQYLVAVDGKSGSFTVVAPALTPVPPPAPAPAPAPVPTTPPPPPAPFNWALWGAVIFVVVAIAGFLIFFLNRRRRAYKLRD